MLESRPEFNAALEMLLLGLAQASIRYADYATFPWAVYLTFMRDASVFMQDASAVLAQCADPLQRLLDLEGLVPSREQPDLDQSPHVNGRFINGRPNTTSDSRGSAFGHVAGSDYGPRLGTPRRWCVWPWTLFAVTAGRHRDVTAERG
jgi:hypothetical protein